MSDILDRAEELAERYNSSGFIHKEATLLLPELIAEIKRLKSFADDLMDNCNILRNRAQQAEAQLQAIIYDEEVPEWTKDYHLLYSALDGPIVEAARKWHQAYRKAQNSNLVRKKQNEQQAAYVTRLEAAFLEADERAIYWEYQYTGTPITDERRKEKSERLLEKIRGEQE